MGNLKEILQTVQQEQNESAYESFFSDNGYKKDIRAIQNDCLL